MKTTETETVPGTGVPKGTKCARCGILAEDSAKLPPALTGINHPEYFQTRSFYRYGDERIGPVTHMCPRCHRESELELTMKAMDAYAAKYGEKALAAKCGLRG